MKKGQYYIIIVLLLSIIAMQLYTMQFGGSIFDFWKIYKENQSATSIADIEAEYAFSVEDTSSITKIIIRDKTPQEVTLTRNNGKWMVNEKYEARPDAIEVLLETLNRQSMRNFVPIAGEKAIIERIAVFGKEVEVYAGEEKIKHFYVGVETPDQTATYMLIKGASKPFSVHIQGFVGYLNTRYFADEVLWRRRILFGLPKDEIARVAMSYEDENQSFVLNNTGTEPVITDSFGNPLPGALPVNYNIFLGSFRTAAYEGQVVETDGIWPKLDSIKAATPKFTLEVTDKSGKTHRVLAFKKRPDKEQVDDDGNYLEYDPDRLYAYLDDGRWVVIQYFGLRNIIVNKDFFFTELMIDN